MEKFYNLTNLVEVQSYISSPFSPAGGRQPGLAHLYNSFTLLKIQIILEGILNAKTYI